MLPAQLLSTASAAQAIGLSKSFLNKARLSGGGPRFVKIGTRVTYDPIDLSNWIESRKRVSTSDSGGAQ